MSYTIRIERGEDGSPVLAGHTGGELPGTLLVTGHEGAHEMYVTITRLEKDRTILSAHAQRAPAL